MNQAPGYGVAVISAIAIIFAAFVTLIGVIYTANISRENVQLAINATRTAEAKLITPTNVQIIAQVTPAATATFIPIPPSPTNTPIPPTSTNTAIATFTTALPTSMSTQLTNVQAQSIPTIIINASDVISKIQGKDGELQGLLNWWREDESSGKSAKLNPASRNLDEKCFGIAWNTNEYGYHRLVVFQTLSTFTFAAGGWYVKVCIPNNIQISSEDVGRIQADWLGKRYGMDNHTWKVIVK